MTKEILAPNQEVFISASLTYAIQNLDLYKKLSFSKDNTNNIWFELDPRNILNIKGPIYLKNTNAKSTITIVYGEL